MQTAVPLQRVQVVDLAFQVDQVHDFCFISGRAGQGGHGIENGLRQTDFPDKMQFAFDVAHLVCQQIQADCARQLIIRKDERCRARAVGYNGSDPGRTVRAVFLELIQGNGQMDIFEKIKIQLFVMIRIKHFELYKNRSLAKHDGRVDRFPCGWNRLCGVDKKIGATCSDG